jgi:hypothetical protein
LKAKSFSKFLNESLDEDWVSNYDKELDEFEKREGVIDTFWNDLTELEKIEDASSELAQIGELAYDNLYMPTLDDEKPSELWMSIRKRVERDWNERNKVIKRTHVPGMHKSLVKSYSTMVRDFEKELVIEMLKQRRVDFRWFYSKWEEYIEKHRGKLIAKDIGIL